MPHLPPQLGRSLGVQRVRFDRRVVKNLVPGVDGAVRLESTPACERFIADATERADIGAMVDGLTLNLLRRHAANRAHHRSRAGVYASPRGRGACLLVYRFRYRQLREPKVEHLREPVP